MMLVANGERNVTFEPPSSDHSSVLGDLHLIGIAVGDATQKAEIAAVELNARLTRIAQLADAIRAVAKLANLLSVNASLEAARVGEAGKGFAVVAQEIKVLGAKSAIAAAEISESISDALNAAAENAHAAELLSKAVSAGGNLVDRLMAERQEAR